MGASGRPSFNKRQKEQARVEKQKRKEEKRAERDADKANRPANAPAGEDPDIAHIIPGPQPIQE